MGKTRPRRFQFSLRTLLVLVAVCALLLGTPRLWYDHQIGPLKDSYTALQVAAMVNAYLDAKECAWPRDWEDLRPFYRAEGSAAGGNAYSFAEVRDCWVIDFDADPVELASVEFRLGEPPFHALGQRHRRRMALPLWEPNLQVYWRLRRNAGAQVAAMVIEHMKANGGAWPRDWDDLRNCHETARNEQGRHYCPFQQARACMAVDFEADPKVLAQAKSLHGERPFCVVYQRHGRTGEGPWDPNQRIFRYLTSQDSANQDSANQDSANQDSANQDSANQDSENQDSENTAGGAKPQP